MNRLSIIAIVVLGLALAGGGVAFADQLEVENYALSALEMYGGGPNVRAEQRIGHPLCLGHPLGTVSRSQVEADFAAGNVSKILNNDITTFGTALWRPELRRGGLLFHGSRYLLRRGYAKR